MSENVDCLQKYRKMTFADDDACLPPALFFTTFQCGFVAKIFSTT